MRTDTRAAAAALTDGGGSPRPSHRPEGAALLARAREGAAEGGLHADDELPVVDQLLEVLLADGRLLAHHVVSHRVPQRRQGRELAVDFGGVLEGGGARQPRRAFAVAVPPALQGKHIAAAVAV